MSQKNIKKSEHLAAAYFPSLDGFRAIAIFMVLAHHARRGFDLDHLYQNSVLVLQWIYFKSQEYLGLDLTDFYFFLQKVMDKLKGILGIEIFFVLSGFLMMHLILKTPLCQNSIKSFYLRRIAKIYPSYIVMLLMSLIVALCLAEMNYGEAIAAFFRHIFFLQNYDVQVPILGHTWSLVIIEQFYLFLPLVLGGICLSVKEKVWQQRILLGVLVFLVILAHVLRFCYIEHKTVLITWPFVSPIPYWTTLYHIDAIMMGCLLSILHKQGYLTRWPKFVGWILWGFGWISFYVLYFLIDWSYYWGDWFLYTWGYLAFIALLIASFNGASFLTRSKKLQWVGRHSYGIYLWHYLILIFWKQFVGILPITFIGVLYLLSAVFCGYLSARYLETWGRAIISRFVMIQTQK